MRTLRAPTYPYAPPTHPYAPYVPLHAPYMPLCAPYVPVHAPFMPLCTSYMPITCDEYQMLWIFRIFPLYSLYNSRMLLANEFIQSGTTYAPLHAPILFLIS